MTGTIVKVFSDRGFGFIKPTDGGADVFCHVRDVDKALAFDETLEQRRVEFDVVNDSEKGPRAANVRAV